VKRTLLVLVVGLSSACASTGAVPRPFPTAVRPGRSAPASPPAPAGGIDDYALVGTALSLRGVPYRDGGSDLTGFDCSGFTQYVFGQYGITLPRSVREQFQTGRPITPQDVAPGDLIFFSTTAPGASHVGIAIGGDEFIHAPSSTGVVRVERMGSSYWGPRFIGAKRVS